MNTSNIAQLSSTATESHVGAYMHGLETKIQDAKKEKKELEERVQKLDAHITFWEEEIQKAAKPSSQGGRSRRKTYRKRKTQRK